MKKLQKAKILFYLLLFLVFLKTEFYLTYKGAFAFTYDQGRDLLEAAKIISDKNIPFIGPTTGLGGIFYGPWWYYFLAIPSFIFNGNPTYIALVFSSIALFTCLSIFFFIQKLTGSIFIPAYFAFIALLSPLWMLAPTFIWSPTFVPISMILLLICFVKIRNEQKPIYYFLYGITSQIILNGEVAFGLMISLWLLFSTVIYRKIILSKKLAYTAVGILLPLIPQLLFEFKNNFLETNAVINYLKEPKIYGEKEPILVRFIQRIDSVLDLTGQAFFRGNKLFASIFLVYIVLLAYNVLFISKNKEKSDQKIIIKYMFQLLIFNILFFTLFQDRVWDYYLIGIPILLVLITAVLFNFSLKLKLFKEVTILLIALIFILNFPKDLLNKFDETKLTDGGAFLNTKRVMDKLVSDNPSNYSLYVFSPAIFDPPFDYLVYWYNKEGLLEQPKIAQNNFYLIIREYSNKKYLSTGWYGDKTKDKSQVIKQEKFIGDLVLEKHSMND